MKSQIPRLYFRIQHVSLLSLALFVWIWASPSLLAQEGFPPLPSMMGDSEGNPLLDMLKTDLLKRLQGAEAANSAQSGTTPSGRRPKPELGKRADLNEPLDLSKYLGPDASPDQTMDHLRELGRLPMPADVPRPQGASSELEIWNDAPLERRLAYLEDLVKRRKFYTALDEAEGILAQKPEEPLRLKTILLREKALFHQKHYDTVQSDYYRLKAFYKGNKEVDELKAYLEKEAGLTLLQNEVKKEPSNPKLQNDLLTAYKQKNWLDFAEEFFIRTIEDTSAPTIKSLSDIYFTKKDYGMLVELSQAGQRLYPDHADFYYNEGVGHYLAQDTNTLPRARECFIAASQKNPTAPLKKNIHWYLNRLQSKK